MAEDPFEEMNARFDELHKEFFAENVLSAEGEEVEFGTFSPASAPNSSLFRADLECSTGTVHVHPVWVEKDGQMVSIQQLGESEDGGWGQTATMDERHDVLSSSTVGYAVYVYYDTFASWETWLATISKDYSSALAVAVWLTHSPGKNSIEDTFEAVTGSSHDPMKPERDQNDILDIFGSVGDQCAITGETEELKQAKLPFYVFPYLTNDTDSAVEAYTGVPLFPFVLPELKVRVNSQLYHKYVCLQDTPSLKRREEGVYAFDKDLREFAEGIKLTETEVSYANWM
jgi:hypothetical protein